MSITNYRGRDSKYEAWLRSHPEGWVANHGRGRSPNYLKIHRATCHGARNRTHATREEPLTGGDYVKTTAQDLAELWAWAASQWSQPVLDRALSRCCCRGVEPPAGSAPWPQYASFGRAPADDPDELQAFARRVRRGQASFRRGLMRVYDSRCAVTGTALDAVLEAAHIEPHRVRGRNAVDNGLVLRADIHILFDVGLLRVHPDSLEIHVDSRVQLGSEYAKLHGRVLRPRLDGGRPDREALEVRWDAGASR